MTLAKELLDNVNESDEALVENAVATIADELQSKGFDFKSIHFNGDAIYINAVFKKKLPLVIVTPDLVGPAAFQFERETPNERDNYA